MPLTVTSERFHYIWALLYRATQRGLGTDERHELDRLLSLVEEGLPGEPEWSGRVAAFVREVQDSGVLDNAESTQLSALLIRADELRLELQARQGASGK
jgi:hypothetical protein